MELVDASSVRIVCGAAHKNGVELEYVFFVSLIRTKLATWYTFLPT